MIIEGFGIKLVRVRRQDIELIRLHRNSDAIRLRMEYRELITPEMQEQWFASINNGRHNYFIIEAEGKPAGLINGSDIDWEKKETGNGGLFVWENEFLETHVPLSASLLLTEVSFLLGMERTYVKVLKDNPHAIAFNRSIGYEILEGQEEVINQKYVLTKANYYRKADRFRRLLISKHGDLLRLVLEKTDGETISQQIAAQYRKQPPENKMRLVLEEA